MITFLLPKVATFLMIFSVTVLLLSVINYLTSKLIIQSITKRIK